MPNPESVKRVAYVELDTHAEIAGYLHQLSQGFREVQVDFYFSPKIAAQLPGIPARVVNGFPELTENLTSGRYSLIILGTVHRYFSYFLAIVQQFHTAVLVHNKNFSRSSPLSRMQGIFEKDTFFRQKLILKEGLLSAGRVYQQAAVRFVLDSPLADSEHQVLPLLFYPDEMNIERLPNHVVIPGAVENSRRNYTHILNCLEATDFPLKVTFLGKVRPKMALKFKELQRKKQNLHLIWFEEKIPANDFTRTLAEASVLWCPLRQETSFLGVREIYGKTKVSGNIFDAARAGTWALFPSDYEVNHPFLLTEAGDPLWQIQQLASSSPDFSGYRRQQVAEKLEKILLASL